MRIALIEILDAELRDERGMTLRWYDVLVKLEDAEAGLPMNELASRILAGKSGLTSVIDRMEQAGFARRKRPAHDRRVVAVLITSQGIDALHAARIVHRRGIYERFVQHLDQRDVAALAHTLQKVRDHVGPLRPGRITT